ncbi:MAG: PASTA domain-containing protein [Bacteroidales bacterium]|nr:PASTA domain-containing protein [Bacteroidales bacterium]
MKGMNARDAVFLLENMGLKAVISGKGKVISQSVLPGNPITAGQRIELKLLNL